MIYLFICFEIIYVIRIFSLNFFPYINSFTLICCLAKIFSRCYLFIYLFIFTLFLYEICCNIGEYEIS